MADVGQARRQRIFHHHTGRLVGAGVFDLDGERDVVVQVRLVLIDGLRHLHIGGRGDGDGHVVLVVLVRVVVAGEGVGVVDLRSGNLGGVDERAALGGLHGEGEVRRAYGDGADVPDVRAAVVTALPAGADEVDPARQRIGDFDARRGLGAFVDDFERVGELLADVRGAVAREFFEFEVGRRRHFHLVHLCHSRRVVFADPVIFLRAEEDVHVEVEALAGGKRKARQRREVADGEFEVGLGAARVGVDGHRVRELRAERGERREGAAVGIVEVVDAKGGEVGAGVVLTAHPDHDVEPADVVHEVAIGVDTDSDGLGELEVRVVGPPIADERGATAAGVAVPIGVAADHVTVDAEVRDVGGAVVEEVEVADVPPADGAVRKLHRDAYILPARVGELDGVIQVGKVGDRVAREDRLGKGGNGREGNTSQGGPEGHQRKASSHNSKMGVTAQPTLRSSNAAKRGGCSHRASLLQPKGAMWRQALECT